jgi:hypothetical protein
MDDAELARLYVEEGLTAAAIGARVGGHETTVRRRLRALGVRMRPPGQAPKPHPACERDGCDNAVLDPRCRHCSRNCRRLNRRLRPRPGDHTCSLDGCQQTFTSTAHQLAKGQGRFCTLDHFYVWRRGRSRAEQRAANRAARAAYE